MAARALVLSLAPALALGQRYVASLDANWRYQPDAPPAPPQCSDPNTLFPLPYDNQQCMGLNHQAQADGSLQACINSCCADDTCEVYQFCAPGQPCDQAGSGGGCWTGTLAGGCTASNGWQSRGRHVTPPPPPAPGQDCTDPRCAPGTDDSAWRTVQVPHDFVVEGNFSASASTSQGFLPFGIGWYRKHFTPPAALASAPTVFIEFDGVQTSSETWLNGVYLGTWVSTRGKPSLSTQSPTPDPRRNSLGPSANLSYPSAALRIHVLPLAGQLKYRQVRPGERPRRARRLHEAGRLVV